MVMKKDDSNFEPSAEGFPPLHGGDKKALSSLITRIQKDFGESVQVGELNRSIETVSTGSFVLDLATGIGGYPRGRITTIAGWESSGKTTHALRAIAAIQERGGTAAFIDTEYALDLTWAERLGVNIGTLLWLQVEDLETAGEVAVDLAQSAAVDMIVLDSVAGSPIKAVVGGDLGDSNMGKRAKIMSDFMPKLNGPVSRNNVWMIFTNQLRDSLDPYKPKPVRPGGHALSFHSSMIVELRSKRDNKTGEVSTKAVVEKNKLSSPGRVAEYTMGADGYINLVEEIATILTTNEYSDILGVTRAGAWYTVPQELFPDMDEAKFMGKQKLEEALAEVEAFERAEAYIKQKMM